MEIIFNLIPNFWQLWLLIIIAIVSYVTTYLTTHHEDFALWQINMFDLKPFNCHLCSFFWLNLFININIAYIHPPFLLWGIITSAVGAYVIYRGNKDKMKEYEDN